MTEHKVAQDKYQFSTLHDFAALREHLQTKLSVLPPQAASLFFMSINEAVNNALFHGNNQDENKKVTLTWMNFAEEIRIVICDEGEGFTPSNLICSDLLGKECGRGLNFIEYGADSYQYNAKGNELTLSKRLASN